MRDMIGLAPTGSGKSAAFLLPLIAKILKMPPLVVEDGPYAIIMAPSRELAIQIEEEFQKLTHDTGLSSVALVGGRNTDT
jgi:ATP-dependent RNA helicase DDX23/PRP28